MRVHALLLAAGAGKRFGSDKRLAKLSNNQTVLETTISRYASAFPTVTVVLRPGEEEQATLAQNAGATVVYAEDAALGMGHSLAKGITMIEQTDCDWVFVGLSDMPYIRPETLTQLIEYTQSAQSHDIVRPVIASDDGPVPGHPIAWPRAYFKELAAATGDQGARALLQTYRHKIKTIETQDPGIALDIDAPEDLDAGRSY